MDGVNVFTPVISYFVFVSYLLKQYGDVLYDTGTFLFKNFDGMRSPLCGQRMMLQFTSSMDGGSIAGM